MSLFSKVCPGHLSDSFHKHVSRSIVGRSPRRDRCRATFGVCGDFAGDYRLRPLGSQVAIG
jgi:hypothetical protein